MKLVHCLAISSMLTISSMAEAPSGTYPIAELEKAKAEALERGKAMAFLVSDPDSKYRKTQDATALAIKELRSYSVVVFLVSQKDEEIVMPPPVVTILRGSTVGLYDPKIILLSPDLTQTFEAVSSEKIVGNPARDTYRELKKTVRTKLEGWESGGKPSAEELIWVKPDGKHYRGRFIEVKDGRLHVVSEKYGAGSVALDALSPTSRAFAEQLAGVATKPKAEASEVVVEAWTSTDGKVVKAKFVSLKDNQLTVETEAGKSFTFPLDRLDQTSQEKAKALAASK